MRILVVDDEDAVHAAYRSAFEDRQFSNGGNSLEALGNELFAEGGQIESAAEKLPDPSFEVTFVYQGLDAVAMISEALSQGRPFQVAFIDIRMPPGIDGKETARRIRAVDPQINLVIVSGYSDHSVTEIAAVAGPSDKIFYISKPFAADEARQMASALAGRWHHDAEQVEILQKKIIELAASEARAVHVANHDFLTSAPNRMAFKTALTRFVADYKEPYTLVALDLDRFKHVNDTFGHGAGDDLLSKIYLALKMNAPPRAIIARLGGDEFGVLFPCESSESSGSACLALIDACSQTFEIFGSRVQISASAGFLYSLDCNENCDASDLMRYADMALYAAKRDGRCRIRQFDAGMDESIRFRHKMENGLVTALQSGELHLVYQPIVERGSLAIVGFEALVRWESVEHGTISPTIFVPIAEESGLIHDLGDWVISKALEDCQNWPDQYVSINFSPKQFKKGDIVEKLCKQASKFGICHSRIQVEITETAIFDNVERAAVILNDLQSCGFRVALDDFGTGYSSLFNIKNFALNCLKIDKSFIDELGRDSSSAAIVTAVTHLARALDLTIVAEGVENDLQCQALRLIGCSHMQGYLFGMGSSVEVARERLLDQAPGEVDSSYDKRASVAVHI